ncbi:MAG TPA: hypothetical protein P5195_04185 [Anaerolineae bacterium]|nr:hypothetical protein [Anaerolineae bacterium]
MSDSDKKGFLSKLFGARKSCCCGVRIEEVPEEKTGKVPEERRPCCGGPAAASRDSDKTDPDGAHAGKGR